MRNTPPPPRRVRTAHESKSATVRAAAAAPSRRQQSKWQREQHQQRRLYIAVGVLLVIVGVIFVGGIVSDNDVRANQVVAQIGPDDVTAAQLLAEVRPAARSLDAQAKQFGGGANIAQYIDQQKRSLPDQTLTNVIATNAPVVPGYSGGPLEDARNRAIGMVTAGSTSGIHRGFAIPIRRRGAPAAGRFARDEQRDGEQPMRQVWCDFFMAGGPRAVPVGHACRLAPPALWRPMRGLSRASRPTTNSRSTICRRSIIRSFK